MGKKKRPGCPWLGIDEVSRRAGRAGWRSVLPTLLLFLCLTVVCGAHGRTVLPADFQEISLAGELAFLDDAGGELSFAQVLERQRDGAFQVLPGFLNLGYSVSTSWLTFSLDNDTAVPLSPYLSLSPPLLDQLDVYLQVGSDPYSTQSYRLLRLGDHIPQAEKPLAYPQPVVPLHLPAGSVQRIFIRVKTTSSHTLSAKLMVEPALVREMSRNIALQAGYLAIALALTAINLTIALHLRSAVHSFFAAYLVALCVSNLGIEGMIVVVAPGLAHHLSDWLAGSGVGFAFTFLSLCAVQLFRTAERHRVADVYLKALSVLGVGVCLASGSAWFGRLAGALFAGGLALSVVLPWLAWRMMVFGERTTGRIFLLAFCASAIGAMITFSRLLGVLPNTQFTYYAHQFASVANMILMTLGLSQRILSAERTAREAQARTLEHAELLAGEMTVELRDRQRRLQDALGREQAAREAQSQFIDLVAHEYRTPLSIIKTNLEILELRHGQAPTPQRLDVMRQAVGRLEEIFDKSLEGEDWGAAEPVRFRRIDLSAFLTAAAQRQETVAALSRRVEYDGLGQLWIRADAKLLRTLIDNLLGNAAKYAVGDEAIGIVLAASEDWATLTVRNRCAPGLPENPEELLERGARGSNAADQAGRGIGLFLVRQMAELLGGEVSLRTEPPGWFEAQVRLPLWDEADKGVR